MAHVVKYILNYEIMNFGERDQKWIRAGMGKKELINDGRIRSLNEDALSHATRSAYRCPSPGGIANGARKRTCVSVCFEGKSLHWAAKLCIMLVATSRDARNWPFCYPVSSEVHNSDAPCTAVIYNKLLYITSVHGASEL